MKNTQGSIYKAEEGNFIVRIADNFIMGEEIDLGSADGIENYKDEPFTEESYKAFYESVGMPIKEKEEEEKKPRNNNEKQENA